MIINIRGLRRLFNTVILVQQNFYKLIPCEIFLRQIQGKQSQVYFNAVTKKHQIGKSSFLRGKQFHIFWFLHD